MHRCHYRIDPLEPRRLLSGSPVTVLGTAGDDQIEIFVAGPGQMNVRVNGTSNLIPIAGTSEVVVQAGGGQDEIFLDSAAVLVSIFGQGDDDELIVADATGDWDAIVAGAFYDGGSGRDSLKMWDDMRPASTASTYTISADSIGRAGFAGMSHTSVERVDLRCEPGDNTFIVNTIDAVITDYDIYGGEGNDTFILAPGGENLATLLRQIQVHGEQGTDHVILHDRTNGSSDTWTITDVFVSRSGWAGLLYNIVESITINAGPGSSTFNIQSTAFFTPVVINAGDGNDVVNLAPAARNLDELDGPTTVNGEDGNDTLHLHDGANELGDTFTITANHLTRSFFGGVQHSGLEAIELNAGSETSPQLGDDTFNINSSIVPTAIRSAGGNDTFNVNETSAPISIDSGAGHDTVNVNVDGAGAASAVFAQAETLAALNVGMGGIATLAPGGANTLVTQALSLLGGGTFDITNNAAVIDYAAGSSPLLDMRTWVTTGYSGGAWNGAGVISSTAAATPQHAVGYAEASTLFGSFPATFAGQQVDDSAVLLRYTRYGDANLDQTVNLQDFNRLAANFGSGSLWSDGDFTFDQLVTLSDFNRLAANFGQSPASADDDLLN